MSGSDDRPLPQDADEALARPHGAESSRPRPHGAESPRPRPQYGEYATPEEQRARIRVPDASASLAAGEAPVEPAAASRVRTPRPSAGVALGVDRTPGARGVLDRVVTIGLLGFGLVNVVTGIPAYLDYPAFADSFIAAAGIDVAFTNLDQGRVWGLAAAVLMGVLWFATAAASYLQLRRERLAFWIPLVGALVAGIAVGICLAVPLLGDPAIVDALVPTPTPTPAP